MASRQAPAGLVDVPREKPDDWDDREEVAWECPECGATTDINDNLCSGGSIHEGEDRPLEKTRDSEVLNKYSVVLGTVDEKESQADLEAKYGSEERWLKHWSEHQ